MSSHLPRPPDWGWCPDSTGSSRREGPHRGTPRLLPGLTGPVPVPSMVSTKLAGSLTKAVGMTVGAAVVEFEQPVRIEHARTTARRCHRLSLASSGTSPGHRNARRR